MKKAKNGLLHGLRGLPLRIRLFLLISGILVFAVSFLSLRMINIYQRNMVQSASAQTLSSLRQTAQSINQKMMTVNDALDQMTMDSSLTDFFIETQTGKTLEARDIYLNTKALGNTIGRYLRQEDIDTYLLYTRSYILGSLISSQSPVLTPEDFKSSFAYLMAVEGNYTTVWLPLYDLEDAFTLASHVGTSHMKNSRYLFSALRQLNFMYYENNTLRVLPSDAERPVIMVNFQASVLSKWIGDNIGYDRVRYRLLSAAHESFYDSAPDGGTLPAFYTVTNEGVGTFGSGADSRMAFITPIACPGWYLTCDVPLGDIVGSATRDAFNLLFGWILLLLLISLAMTYLVAKGVTKPIADITGAVHKVAAGDFSVRMDVPREKEFWELTNAFNRMGAEIQRLIHENYDITLKETQSQLAALNLQLNPHFLYNTLNVMNLIALENDQRELSRMITALSKMLQYAIKRNNGLVSLREELEWLTSYLTVMEERFEGMFSVVYDVDEAALRFDVPKLILQPVVENCFVHGHIGSSPGGRIVLSARLSGDMLALSVQDNGLGMDEVRVRKDMCRTPTDGHIGLTNAYQRMKLIYGREGDIRLEKCAGGGSRVTLMIPRRPQGKEP